MGSPLFRVGVSGFSYPAWRGAFYPKEAKSEELLAYYAKRLDSVEINSTFYAQPRGSAVKGWADRTSPDFVFSFKAPQEVTHIRRLGKPSLEVAERFSKALDALGPRKGPILFQLPPYSKQDLSLLADFLVGTRGIVERVFEFRHRSWLEPETYRLLEENHAAFCIAETEDLAPVFQVTAGFAYFRLRKDSYDAKSVDRWAEKIAGTAAGASKCYAYLRHDATGENAVLAERLCKKLEA